MAVSTITITDKEDGEVKVLVDFVDGIDEDSAAHGLAVRIAREIMETHERTSIKLIDDDDE